MSIYAMEKRLLGMGSLAMPYKEIGGPSSVRQAADCIIINYGILLG